MLDSSLALAMADIFGLEPREITSESSPANIEYWDSVGHLRLILHLEEVFHTQFPSKEIPSLTTAARIESSLRRLHALSEM